MQLDPMSPQDTEPTPSEGQHSFNHRAGVVEAPAGHIMSASEMAAMQNEVDNKIPTPELSTDLKLISSDEPTPVVKVLSVRGVEYGMMTIALWVAASTLAWILLNMLNGSTGFDGVVVPTSALVVCLPAFAFFFLRLKKAELANPPLKLDPSKRRWSQSTQFLVYIALLINFIYFVYVLMQHAGSGNAPSIGKSIANLVVVLIIAGGILAYYWHDEHRNRKT